MSVKATHLVWEKSEHKGSDLLVFLAIADHVGNENGVAWPGILHLAAKCRMSKRNTQYCVKALIDSGELILVRRGEGRKSSVYKLDYAKLEQRCNLCTGDTRCTAEVTPVAPQGGSPLHPNHKGTVRESPPIVPQGGRPEKADRIAAIFHRKPTTPWNAKEVRAFKAIGEIDDDELCMVERRYDAERGTKDNTLRRDLCTFLNNYQGEVDRARAWCEKHPVRSKTLRTRPQQLEAMLPPPDPESTALFLAQFKERHGRLPYGFTENGGT